MDASRIVDALWVGSAPPPGDYRGRFDVIVLVAEGYQPPAEWFPGVVVRRFPFDDGRPKGDDLMMAWSAAEAVARDIGRGRRVLVTCEMGRNRSALVAALALHLITGEPGSVTLKYVRSRRTDPTGVKALSNPWFQGLLRSLP